MIHLNSHRTTTSLTAVKRHLILKVLSKKRQAGVLEQGFTLVELLIVVIIIGILSAVAVPAFLNQQGRASISAAQTAAMDAARACASARVTGDTFTPPSNVTGTCTAAGADATFTAVAASFNVTTAPVATATANGGAALTTCAAANGWTAGTAPACTPTRAGAAAAPAP